ncbi:hypothetical protein SLA2020_024760 [Shorea laevis]
MNASAFNDVLGTLLDSLKTKAASSGSLLKFGTRSSTVLPLTQFMHLHNALLICPSCSAPLVWMILLQKFQFVVMENEEAKWLDEVAI